MRYKVVSNIEIIQVTGDKDSGERRALQLRREEEGIYMQKRAQKGSTHHKIY